MRVLILSWEYPPHIVGGLGAHVGALVPALARAGVQVSVLTPRFAGGPPEETIEHTTTGQAEKKSSHKAGSDSHQGSATVYRVDPPSGNFSNFVETARQTNFSLADAGDLLYAQHGAFDLIHAHDWLVEFSATPLKNRHKTPLLATIHATERGRGRGFLSGPNAHAINEIEWRLTYEAWRVICTSRFMADEVRVYFGVPADKIEIVANGVDGAPLDALDKVDLRTFRGKWARPEQLLVFSVGRLVHEKGAHLIVEAAPRILAQFPNVQFVIAGTGSMSDHVKRRVWELGISNNVNIAGFVSDADRDRLLKVADAAVFPSLYEPFGIVALEAMAAKCPVVVSAVGGLGEVVQHAKTGLTIYPDNVDSLAWGILQTLQNTAAARTRSDRAYRMVKNEYNWDHIAENTIAVYERIIRERHKSSW